MTAEQRRRLAAMSEITDRIEAYVAAGRKPHDWDLLRDWLSSHVYVTPRRYDDPQPGPLDCRDWDNIYVDGSWDEVDVALAKGGLTRDEYMEVLRNLAAAAGRA